MEKKILAYLELIDITTPPLIERVERIQKIQLELCKEEVEDIFIDEYITADGKREYEDLSFFSKNYFFGAKRFLSEDTFLLTKLNEKFDMYTIKQKNYDFKKATDDSRLQVNFSKNNISTGIFKASKLNCDCLRDILSKYMMPNLRE
jgi:hypothetical protein